MSSSVLSIGIIGLPNVGKSTLFNALLKKQLAFAANYPFATIEPNIGIVDVPDKRLSKLAEIVKPKRIIPAVVKFVDIAGLVKGASKGEGLGNQFLANIREVDAIVHVVRAFEDENVVRSGSISPEDDIKTVRTELYLSDVQTLQKKVDSSKTKKVPVHEIILTKLDKEEPILPERFEGEEKLLVKELNLFASKPIIYVYNISENDIKKTEQKQMNKECIYLSARIESELYSLSDFERVEYMKELGISEGGLDKLIRAGFDILGLQTFFTAGPKEVRAWTIPKGTKAPQAAGVIHTDFERGFISAQVIAFKNYIENSGVKACKEKGLISMEGKEYTMKDGDVVEFNFSV